MISSLARNRTTNRDESNQGNQDQHGQELRAENQGLRAENQKLRAKPHMTEAQVLEMAMLMRTLKSNYTNEDATAAAAGANPEKGPSVTSEPAQIIYTENPERVGVHQVFDLVDTPETPFGFDSPIIASQDYPAAAPQVRNKYQLLKERLRIIERSLEARDPNPVPYALLSPMFKVPDFDKFEGMTCPVAHTARYCELMFPLTEDYKLVTYCFRESLAGEALSWYMQEHTHTSCWETLVNAFLERFNYNIGKAPNKAHLQNMAQRNKETFREYVWRWRHLAAQITPSLPEEEKVDIFMNTLPPLYYDQLIGNAPLNFKDLILAGENLESGVRNGKTAEATPIAESRNVSYGPKVLPRASYSSTQIREGQENYVRRKPEDFDPIPMSYSDLLDHLVSHDLISIRFMKPVQPPFPRSYDPKATCKFHGGGVGHSVENCKALKHVVQDLVDSKYLSFDDKGLPMKEGGESSAVADKEKVPQCNPIPMSYADLCSYLISHGWVTPRKMRPVQPPFPMRYNPEVTCEFHFGAFGHSTENCKVLKSLVQGLVDTNQLSFEKGEGSGFQGLWTIKQEL